MAVRFVPNPMFLGWGPMRLESDLRDCEVEGELPVDLDGAFYRVGPDYQYPPKFPHNIPFDGEGHVSLFRFANGHVDFKSRYVRTQRFKAQAEARRAIFGMYRNPYSDDAVVAEKKISRGTANTQIVFHHGKLLALKEDSPPVAMDPNTLETLDDYYTFGGKYAALAHTAHPKIDSETGELIGYGYEARGEMSNDVYVYSADRHGKINWETWIKVPYVGMLHDFAVTSRHIAFLVIPMATNVAQMKQGGVRFAWDSKLPTWFGFMRRGGDGTDLRWYQGPERCATHVMGAFSDGDRVFVDMDMANKNQFPFFPNLHGEAFDPIGSSGRITRLTVRPDRKSDNYDMDVLFQESGVLPRQDDRYHTVPYRYGFMPTTDYARPLDERLAKSPLRPLNCYTRFDQLTRKTSTYFVGPTSGLQECCFVPRRTGAPEGDGYLVGIANRLLEGRSDLVIVDTSDLEAGPIATVKLPYRTFGQIHGWWVPGDQLK
ncbi:MAG TPA: carotenoid oxygenase family protein [Steroidobacteraceae bacterium]|nr:carotenoid oxygenase family protein [Steroidobacteraceae bacterium]